jgi:hypothetical protein
MTTLVHNPDTHRLGKQDAKPPHVLLEEFVDFEMLDATDPLPANIINSQDANGQTIALAMYLNDRQGCCTCAGAGNILRIDSDGETQITDDNVETGYVAVTTEEGAAFNPATGANDNGCAEIDVLDYWVSTGFGGDKLLGHAGIKVANIPQIRRALHLTGALYPGFQLSTDQQTQQIWAPGPAAPGSWGGHCPPLVDWYTQIPAGLTIGGVPIPASLGQVLAFATWGALKPGTEPYVPFACDEMHCLITDAWLKRNESNPAINMTALKAYLSQRIRES